MSKKNFTGENPALAFISTAPKTEDTQHTHNKHNTHNTHNTHNKSSSPTTPENPPRTAPDTVKPERKSKRVNLLIRPSSLESLTKIARMKQTSVNDLLNTLAENFIAEEAETLARYDETFPGC